jgi:hypothetical protein
MSRKRINPPTTSSRKALKQTPNLKRLHSGNQKPPLSITKAGVTNFSDETARLLDWCCQWFHRYVIVTSAQGVVLAVWTLHCYAIAAAETTAYLHVTAPEKGCGKSRLLEVLEQIVKTPCLTGGMTAAALVRTVDKDCPTLLLDEMDAAFGGEKEFAESLRGILNEGFRRGGNIRKCDGKNHDVRTFQVFGPKALAGIGKIPDTIASRCIVIQMRRKLPEESVEPFRIRDVRNAAKPLREALGAWEKSGVIKALERARPVFREGLSDRQLDMSEPLLAIADLAGGEWPALLRHSLSVLFSSAASEDASRGVALLLDVRAVFNTQTGGHGGSIFTSGLVAALNKMEESPWSGWNKGTGMTAANLAKLLKPYNITPGTVRIGSVTSKGYKREAFNDVWNRYLAPLSDESPDIS